MSKLFINPQPKYKNIPPVKGVELQKIKKQEPLEKTGIMEIAEDNKNIEKKKKKLLKTIN